jgi:hypothetical protein
LVNDCRAVHEVAEHASDEVKNEFRALITAHIGLWEAVPLIEAQSFGLPPGVSLLAFFQEKLPKLELWPAGLPPRVDPGRGLIGGLTGRLDEQAKHAAALANLEFREKFGTISSRTERLEAIRGKRVEDLTIEATLDPEERERRLEWRAQIMYLIYDCLAVHEVYDEADLPVQNEFKGLIDSYSDVWETVPLVHPERFGLDDTATISTFMNTQLSKLHEASASGTAGQ